MFNWFKRPNKSEAKAPATLYLSAASETDARAAAVLPTAGSEDARSVRGEIDVPKCASPEDRGRDYLPESAVEWVVSIQFASGAVLQRDEIKKLLDGRWRQSVGYPQLFGRAASTGRWTFVLV